MIGQDARLARAAEIGNKAGRVLQKRVKVANERFRNRVNDAYTENVVAQNENGASPWATTPWDLWTNWIQYTTDAAQRWVLFWDTIRKRGNNAVEHERAGKPPVLHFQYETVLDARTFEHPVNYALLRMVPPAGVLVDPKRRPYVIIDPRAGHGPGIGGFKDDSEIGVALRAGHPVYFVMFYAEPQAGQTPIDVCAAERQFIRKVRELHPGSPKPAIVGNCQGGWAVMMLAASDPELTGPLVIAGAPMAYWSGAWSGEEGDNPMRYTGGLLGGSWLSSLFADLGNGAFDGAYLVQNFESLNPANTYWDKYYNLYAKIDTEPPRFLDFERWWSGFYLLSKEEIEWIVQNLFVGNKLWMGDTKGLGRAAFDLREIKSPIILFASMGDNITPPQQAFNWVADTYGSTEEIKARGQVIVGLVHRSVGHLGIFVSGSVAKKEHAQIVSVLKSIEVLTPGLYGMHINERKDSSGKTQYEVEFREHRLEEIISRINRFQRADERAFDAAAKVSEFNQRAYDLFMHPIVQSFASDYTAKVMQLFHPLRVQRWLFSDLNPWMAWLGPAADIVKAQREPSKGEQAFQPFRQSERMTSELISASLDYYRDLRDAISETMFFHTYGTMYSLLRGDQEAVAKEEGAAAEPHALPEVQTAVASIAKGGYAEALSRTGYLLAFNGEPLPLAQLQLKQELMDKYSTLIPNLPPEERRRIRGTQEIICTFQPMEAIATLPQLLSNPEDRHRYLTLLNALVKDPQINFGKGPTPQQMATVNRIRKVLSEAELGVA